MYGRYFKRPLDFIMALSLLVLLLPILFIIGILVRVFLGTPILFKQERAGFKGRPFTIYKFRTMRDLYDGEGHTLSDAQRLTKFGRFLRKTSLDELPELFNILKGEMSLVGPRPLLVKYLPLYSKKQMRRHDVLPGITGWAQVQGRNTLSWPEKFNLDIWYVDHQTFCLDIKILALTFIHVFLQKGIDQKEGVTMEEFKGEKGVKNDEE